MASSKAVSSGRTLPAYDDEGPLASTCSHSAEVSESATSRRFEPSCMAPAVFNPYPPFSGKEGGPKLPVVSAFILFCMRRDSAHSSSGVHRFFDPLGLDMAHCACYSAAQTQPPGHQSDRASWNSVRLSRLSKGSEGKRKSDKQSQCRASYLQVCTKYVYTATSRVQS